MEIIRIGKAVVETLTEMGENANESVWGGGGATDLPPYNEVRHLNAAYVLFIQRLDAMITFIL